LQQSGPGLLHALGTMGLRDRYVASNLGKPFVITLEPITEQNVLIFKAARLRALKDTPSAFGATYAKESLLTNADWIRRAARWNGESAVLYLAMDGNDACGIAGSLLDEADATRAHLISMWTSPTHRRQGVGRLLVDQIFRWARLRGAGTMLLLVTSNNDRAIAFYKTLGFTLTGRTEPYPNDPALVECEMSRPIP
jgi:ribosomal protein S18 acetylase RimI-like enzyme